MAELKALKALQKPTSRLVVGGAIGLAFGVLFATMLRFDKSVTFLKLYELATIDIRYKAFGDPNRIPAEIVVLAIDEPTVRGIENDFQQSWPPDRWFWERIITSLSVLGARAIVFDVTFADRRDLAKTRDLDDPFSGCLRKCEELTEYTITMARAANAAGNVVFAVNGHSVDVNDPPDQVNRFRGALPMLAPYLRRRVAAVHGDFAIPTPPPVPNRVTLLQFPEGNLLAGTRAVGYADVNGFLDTDNTSRRSVPIARIGEWDVPDLAISAYAVAHATTSAVPAWDFAMPPPPDSRSVLPEITVREGILRIGSAWLPLREDGTAWIRWRGDWTSKKPWAQTRVREAWPLIEAYESILLGDGAYREKKGIQPGYWDFKDKVVFVGYTLQGPAADNLSTPFGHQPGVFRQVSAYDTLVSNEQLHSPARWVNMLLLIVASVLSGAAVLGTPDFKWQMGGGPVRQTASKLLPGMLVVATWGLVSTLAFRMDWILNVVHTVLGATFSGAFAAVTAYAFIGREERRRREQVHGLLTRAFSPEVAAEAIAREDKGESVIGGKRHTLTLYFSDIAGFTTISEKLAPEELVRLLNEYLTRVTELFGPDKYNGTVDKYIGDAVMAFWGAPVPRPDGPILACKLAVEAIAVMDQYSAELVARGLPPLKTRIGINTGPAVAGFIGATHKLAYTALGDTVNLASRLEGANKAYGTICMIGPETYEGAKEEILARELDLLKVKGKKIPVRVYELMGLASDSRPRERQIKARYEAALALYRKGEFDAARKEFVAIAGEFDDPPSRTLIAYCDEHAGKPVPAEWDGSNELHEK